MSELLTNLNESQQQAVTHKDGPLLILAGAGTGKTTVITSKMAWLVLEQGIKPEEILALTFTDKAAAEMEERVDRLLPLGYADLWISTFHSFAERILKEHALEIGLPNDYKLLSQTEQWLLVRQNLNRFNLDYYRPLGNPTKFIHALIKLFSRAKDEAITPEDYLAYVEKLKASDDTTIFLKTAIGEKELKKLSQVEIKALYDEELVKQMEIASAYQTYQQLLLENDAMDFGDLINYVLKLFKTRKNILAKYRAQFQYILVDEFQDTNWAQYELVKLLASPKNNLTVVGDDDQCLPGDAKILTEKGAKRIDAIKTGEKVLSAVGKSSVGYYPVTKVFKNKKLASFITFVTSSGKELTVTDNHKMFGLTLAVGNKKYFYVYLMQRIGLGWRIGVTNDLSARLRLERSADRIIGIKACVTESEARYFETLYSLKYQIPTVCFSARKGVVIKDDLLDRLYQDIDTDKSVKALATDLNIDLLSHHYSLAAVNRGKKLRIKINLELCHRLYHAKSNGVLVRPKVSHLLSLETSDQIIVNKLRHAGFNLKQTKKGARLRVLSMDLQELGSLAVKLEELTGGIIENFAVLGKISSQSRKSMVMPAKNILLGNYLPVQVGNKIVLEEVVEIKKSQPISKIVYDLEVSGPHNFCADGIVVHNSVYKFRGASISNILQFQDDFPKSEEILLNDNYRSSQTILDLSYQFIQRNNPNRLEAKLAQTNKKLSKKLLSKKSVQGEIEHLHGQAILDEVELTVNKIIDLYNKDKEINWSDFAILVRANAGAEVFLRAMDLAKVPYIFMASKGLYGQPIILDLLAWFRLLDDYHENTAMYRILNFNIWQISHIDIMKINYWARLKAWSLYDVCRQNEQFDDISAEAREKIKTILGLLQKHTESVKAGKRPSSLAQGFWQEAGYLKALVTDDSIENREQLGYLNQFYKKMRSFEQDNTHNSLKNFMQLMELELEAGEAGSLSNSVEDLGPDSVKVMTVHASKGLEFKYVFIVNLVDKKFPSISRGDQIELPAGLIKEVVPEGDIHLQEERRLFYVAMTRAKEGLYFTSAVDYGGARGKKISRFLAELSEDGLKLSPEALIEAKPVEVTGGRIQAVGHERSDVDKAMVPQQFSFTQIKSFESCPYQYRFIHILKIPTEGKHTFSFGTSMHSTMQKFFQLVANRKSIDGENFEVSREELEKIYADTFIDEWYPDAQTKEDYRERGLKSVKDFYDIWLKDKVLAQALEQKFVYKLDPDCSIRGSIDRIDKLGDGVRIIDYKTGKPKTKLEADDKEQLLIYQLAAQESLGLKVNELIFYYFTDATQLSFLGTEKETEKLKEKIRGIVAEIKQGEFPPTKNKETCKWCDFKNICDFAV